MSRALLAALLLMSLALAGCSGKSDTGTNIASVGISHVVSDQE